MKNSKKMFILIEAGLAALVLVLALCTVWEKNGKNRLRVSVIIQNSNASQWSAFKYGLRMAAEDQDIELFVVSTVENMTAGQEKELIMNEAAQGADALILQPVPGLEETGVIQEVKKKIPVMLIEPEDPRADQYPCPSTQPDQYALGNALARELVNDYDGKMDGKP